MQTFDLIVIGAGSGGLVAAELAAKLGASVALIEASDRLGGECLHTGCVPSKALIQAARTMHQVKLGRKFGVIATPTLDYAQLTSHINASRKHIEKIHDNDAYYQALGVTVVHGKAEFLNDHTIQVGTATLRAKKFIIATGSKPAIPSIPGINDGEYLTNESIFNLKQLPKSLVVIGGGPIGCELGQAFAMLGSEVTIIQSAKRILPRDEPAAAGKVAHSLKEMGVTVHADSTIQKITYGQTASVELLGEITIHAEKLLIAVGREAVLPLNLTKAGVQHDGHGITVNGRLQSSNHDVYAIGDCNGGPQFTHAAAQQATIAVQNIFFGVRRAFSADTIPWTTFTTPEVAHFGRLKSELDTANQHYQSVVADYTHIDKATTEAEDGYIEVIIGSRSTILAATVVGHNAAEIIAQIRLAKDWKSVSKTLQAYPTYASGVWLAAGNDILERFNSSYAGRLARAYRRLQ
jgi:pyruvate/2-oxoglutarate dehydrogenase complex dihydrolipoamide dehydrogenase (E3) component